MSVALSQEIRARIWAELDWSKAVPKLAQLVVDHQELQPAPKASLLRELAELCEFCVLDPQVAADLYAASFQNDRSQGDVLARMRHLCQATGRSDHAARTAELEYRQSKDPRYHAIAGQAWLDAGDPDRALKPLLQADKVSPGNPHLVAALEVARREWANPEQQAELLLKRARLLTPERPILGLQAARILRMLDYSDARYEEALALCLEALPNLPSACNLMELYLFDEGRLDDLAQHFRRRAKSAPNAMMATRFLFQGSSLLFRAGAGLQAGPLFALGIEQAVRADFRSIPGLLAQLRALLVTGANERAHVIDYAEQVCDRLESVDEQVGVSIFCAQIAWYAQKDFTAARRWLQRLQTLCGQHSLLVDFELAESMMHATEQTTPPLPAPETTAAVIPDERRQAPRRNLRANIELGLEYTDRMGTISKIRASTLDISALGALVKCEKELRLDQVLDVVLSLPSASGLSHRRFKMTARVARNMPGQGVGLAWIDPSFEFKSALAALPESNETEAP